MNKGLVAVFSFIIGAGAGGFIANHLLSQKYEQRVEEEIRAVRMQLLDLQADKEQPKRPEETKAEAIAAMKNYSEPAKAQQNADRLNNKPVEKKSKPYIIDPKVFDSADNPYTILGLVMYTDGTIAEKMDSELHVLGPLDIDKYIGMDAVNHFGEYEDDRICVRNDEMKTDFEVVLVNYTYGEMLRRDKPYLHTT